MALSAKLQLRQSQSLVMTPQLMQSIRLLQFTQAELEQFIEQEIERNPLIERADSADEAPAEAVESPAFEADSVIGIGQNRPDAIFMPSHTPCQSEWVMNPSSGVKPPIAASLAARPGEPVAVSIRLPFCAARCLFCERDIHAAQPSEVIGSYVAALAAEATLPQDRPA